MREDVGEKFDKDDVTVPRIPITFIRKNPDDKRISKNNEKKGNGIFERNIFHKVRFFDSRDLTWMEMELKSGRA